MTGAETMARAFNAKRKPDYADAMEFLDLISSVDADAIVELADHGFVIKFSDGSQDFVRTSGSAQ